jgi:N-hydroxyarylamine O-acetyltransferase
MPDTVDLDAYFQRIGYTGSRQPALDSLRGIYLRHALTIPFENLDPLLRRPVQLDLHSLENKLVHGGRGGYCFEQNLLLGHVLRKLGFHVTDLTARVLWGVSGNLARPRTHMLMQIELNEDGTLVPYIADVGFGGMKLTGPIRLAADIEQATPHEPFRLIGQDHRFVLQALVRDAWTSLYEFDLQPQLLPDYEMANWYVSNHPDSHFVSNLLAALPTADRRYALLNNQLSIHHLGGASEQHLLHDVRELRAVLETTFGITLPGAPDLDTVLGRLVANGPGPAPGQP